MSDTIGTVRMELERETKGTVLYKTADTGDVAPLARNIYVVKSQLTRPYPLYIDVTIASVT